MIGFVTSASPAGAAAGVASAVVDAAALRRLRSRRFHPTTVGGGGGGVMGGTAFAMLRVPSASPAAVVPASLTVALESSPVDAAWW